MHKNARFTPAMLTSVGKCCRWLPLLALISLTACQMRAKERPMSSEAPPPPVFINPQVPVTCRAAEARFALGQTATSPLLEQIRVRTGARFARTVSTTDATASTDVDDGRVSVDVEPNGRIVAARCG